MGAIKCSKKEDDKICRRQGCGQKREGKWHGQEETVPHAFYACEPIRMLWRWIIGRWNVHTHEQLDPEDERLVRLGDRGEGAHAYTEEMWRVVHAAGQWVVHSTRIASRDEEEGWGRRTTATRMQMAVLTEVRIMAYARMQEQRRCNKWKQFHLAWIETGGMTVDKKKGVRMHILSSGKDAPTLETQCARARIQTFTDGSFIPSSKEDPLPIAGVGIAEFITADLNAGYDTTMDNNKGSTGGTDTALRMVQSGNPGGAEAELSYVESTRVIIEKGDPDFIGAKKHSNNTGECTAMYRALSRALSRPPLAGDEDIWADSLYAINMTTGKWMPGKHKNETIIRNLRQKWKQVQEHRGANAVRLRHVRAHTGVLGNELVDRLAAYGGSGKSADMAWATQQMRAITAGNRLSPHPPSLLSAGTPLHYITSASDPRLPLGIG